MYIDPTFEMPEMIMAGALMFVLSCYLVAIAFWIIVNWVLFKKFGKPGWACLIPVYNQYIVAEAIWGNGWKFLLLMIPLANIYFSIKLRFDYAKAFGKGLGFGLGLLFLPIIFYPILAFGDIPYIPVPKDTDFPLQG